MKVPKIFVPANDPVLNGVAAPVDVKDAALLRDLSSGLDRALKTTTGIGLALPQVGIGLRGFMLRESLFVPRIARFCFNPSIVESSSETEKAVEGCLSLPNQQFEVERPKAVKVEYTNARGQVTRESLRGLPARAFQHELDHLDGLLISRFLQIGGPKPVRETIPVLAPPAVEEPKPEPGLYAIYGEDRAGIENLDELAKAMKDPDILAGQQMLRVNGFEGWSESERRTAAQRLKGWIEDHPGARAEVYARFADAQVLLCRACPDLIGRIRGEPAVPVGAAPGLGD